MSGYRPAMAIIVIFILLSILLIPFAASTAELKPDIVVSGISIGSGNKVQIVLANNGQADIPPQWSAVASVMFDQTLKGYIDMSAPTSTTNGGISKAGGASTYLTAWEVAVQTTIYVIADVTDGISESNESNNSGSALLKPDTPTPTPTPSATSTPANTPTPIPTPSASPRQTPGPPLIMYTLPADISGMFRFEVPASDPDGVDRILLYVDGQLIFTDYSIPFELPFDSSSFGDGPHEIKIEAFDALGNKSETIITGDIINKFLLTESPVDINIVNPAPSANVYGSLEVSAGISHTKGARIKSSEILIDGVSVKRLNYSLTPPLKGDIFGTGSGIASKTIQVKYLWNTAGLSVGSSHVIEIEAEDEFGNAAQKSVRVTKITEPELDFRLTRTVLRYGNRFRVSLTIGNIDDLRRTVRDITVRDISRGFQAASFETAPSYDFTRAEITVPKQMASLAYDASNTFSYDLVPVLYEPEMPDYLIGTRTEIQYTDSDGRRVTKTYNTPYQPGDYTGMPYPVIPQLVADAFTSADYVILTDPGRLFHYFTSADVNRLLMGAATLAVNRNAVLAYRWPGAEWLSGYSIRDNFEADGIWAKRFPASTLSNAYLLLLGETEIIPSFNIPGFNVGFNIGIIDTVRITDYPYSDIAGDERPELRVGRILGENVAEMQAQLDASIGVHLGRLDFNRSDALLVSGSEGTWETFITESRELGTLFGAQGIAFSYMDAEYHITEKELLREALVIRGDYRCLGDPGHCPLSHPPADLATLRTLITIDEAENVEADRRGLAHDYTIHATMCDSADARGIELKAGAVGSDIIFWCGHGGPGGWGWVLDDFMGSCGATNLYGDLPANPMNFGMTVPFVFAGSCLTGNYEEEPGRSGARAFLRNRAGVYIGATEVSPAGYQQDMLMAFFRDYWNAGHMEIGDAFARLKYDKVLLSDRIWRYMVYEYNLYGDPKFGGD